MTLTPAQAAERHDQIVRFGEQQITEVKEEENGYSILAGSTGFGLSKKYGVQPKVGDMVRVYAHLGSRIRGIDLNGEPVFFRTEKETEQDQKELAERMRRRRDEEFAAQADELVERVMTLPGNFRRRIEWFERHNPRFGPDYMAYELSVCEDAVKIANWAVEASKDLLQPPEKMIDEFHGWSWELQNETIPDLFDGHSGNSFGFAMRLARHQVTEPEMVYYDHGALTPLVGCEEYGCAHPRANLELFEQIIARLKAKEEHA